MKDVKTMTPEEGKLYLLGYEHPKFGSCGYTIDMWVHGGWAVTSGVTITFCMSIQELLARLRSEEAARNFGDSRKSSAVKYIRDFANRLLAAMDQARDKS
jgi:hypothetical protein